MACQRIVVPRPTTWSYLFVTFTNLLGLVAAQMVEVSYTENNFNNVGPLVRILCAPTNMPALPGNSDLSVEWKHNSTNIMTRSSSSTSSLFKEAYESRYSLLTDNSFVLQIRNAFLEDGGLYTCIVSYNAGNVRESINGSTFVNLTSYLPPLEFPRCSIEQDSLTIANGGDATFICDQGHSNPPVNLELILVRSDGTRVTIGDDIAITRMIEIEDNGAMFICNMTSLKFPTVPSRNCSLGPINVIQYIAPLPSTTLKYISSPLTFTHTTQQQTTGDALGAPNSQGATIGGIVGVIVIILIVLLLVFIFLKMKSRKRTGTSDQSSVNGGMVNVETRAASKPRPTISPPMGKVAFSRPSIDLTADPSITFDHDYAFDNNAVADEATHSDVPSGTQDDHGVDLYHDMDEAKVSKPVSNGHAANKYEDTAPVPMPSLNNDQTAQAYPSTNELEGAKSDETSPASVIPVYGKVNKNRNTVHSENATEIALHNTDPVIYESADELDLEDNASETANPFSAVRPPHLYDRVKDSKNDLDVVGANHQEDNSGYASADEIDAHCRVPPVDSQPPANGKVNTGYENVPNDATGLSKKQNATQEPGNDPPYESTNDIDLDKTTAPTLATSETPVYGKVIKNTIKTDDNDTASASDLPNAEDRGSPVDADTEGIDLNANGAINGSEPPVYSEVNKGHKEDPDNKGRESEGFVKNIIYVPGSAPES